MLVRQPILDPYGCDRTRNEPGLRHRIAGLSGVPLRTQSSRSLILADGNRRADMICGVVRHKKQLAETGLTAAVVDGRNRDRRPGRTPDVSVVTIACVMLSNAAASEFRSRDPRGSTW